MNLRSRKFAEEQAESFKHNADDIENTVPSILTEEESALDIRSSKRVKLKETKSVLNKTIKIEEEKGGFNHHEENESDSKEIDKRAITNKVSE